ncbi:MAG: PqqD family protein [Bacteroidales bacterium]|nr:PqqD family protein [Bacteroidales bacterium]
MKIKKGFVIREICGETLACPEGASLVDFSMMIRLNETSAFLWKEFEGKEFTEETLADALCERYTVEREVALSDVKALVAQLKEIGIIE